MTIKDLEDYRQLKNEVAQINESLNRLLDNKNALVFDTVKGSGQVLPYQERLITIQGVSRKYAATFAKRKKRLEDSLNKCLDKMAEIEDFIKTVHRSDIRQIIEYRYIRGLSWVAVSRRVYGVPSENRARMAITRFFAEI